MDLKKMNEDWKDEAPNLAAMNAANPFTVPEKYFENLNENLQARIKVEGILAGGSEGVFKVPEGYFDSLEEQILSSVKLEKFKTGVPSNDFPIPEGYFDKLQNSILAKTIQEETRKEVKVRSLLPSWYKYAVAACITAVIGTGVFLNFRTEENAQIEAEFSKIPETEIINYLQAYSTTGDADVIAEQLIEINGLPDTEIELSEQDIKQYLESTL